MSVGTIILIILVIALLGGFSGIGGGRSTAQVIMAAAGLDCNRNPADPASDGKIVNAHHVDQTNLLGVGVGLLAGSQTVLPKRARRLVTRRDRRPRPLETAVPFICTSRPR